MDVDKILQRLYFLFFLVSWFAKIFKVAWILQTTIKRISKRVEAIFTLLVMAVTRDQHFTLALVASKLHPSWSEVNNIGLELTKGECWFAGWPTNFATILLISKWEKYINTIIQCVIYLKNKSLYQCIWFLAMNPFSILWY